MTTMPSCVNFMLLSFAGEPPFSRRIRLNLISKSIRSTCLQTRLFAVVCAFKGVVSNAHIRHILLKGKSSITRIRFPDVNGASWRCKVGADQQHHSTLEDAFTNAGLTEPLAPTLLWSFCSIPRAWTDVCGFVNLVSSQKEWLSRKHSTFEINREEFKSFAKDQTCHSR